MRRRETVNPRGHSELLAAAIADVLAEAGVAAARSSAVVAGIGPGPYTGLRVGLVTAAAFADALADPDLRRLLARCHRAPRSARRSDLLVATDARRGEVYWARYDRRGERVAGPQVARPEDVAVDGAGDQSPGRRPAVSGALRPASAGADCPDTRSLVASCPRPIVRPARRARCSRRCTCAVPTPCPRRASRR